MTQPPPLSPDEPARLASLRACNLVDTPLEERFERITRLAKRSLGAEIAAFSLVEADRQWFKSIQGLDVEGTSRDVSFCGHTILDDREMVIEDATKDPRFAENPLVTGPPNIRLYAGYPVRAPDGSHVGSLCVIDSQPRSFGAEDREILRDLAGMVEAELRDAAASALHAELLEMATAERRRAMVDPLTRVWSREGALGVAEEALARTARDGEGAALVMVDIDRFKSINDTHGHAGGDETLRVCARRMLGAVREGDVVGRLSGDEFLLILSPCESAEAGARVVERVRARIAEQPVRWKDGSIEVSASFGIAFVEPGAGAVPAEVIERADRALYDSKRSGRNRVRVQRHAA